ncbi:MAG: transposase [Nitrososphaerales archaeon]
MKTVKYSWQDKARELMCSIVSGCDHAVTINHKLVPDTKLANEVIRKDRFADQSGINRLLHSLTEDNLKELETIYAQDYLLHGIAGKRPSDEMIFVDLDMSGFRADGKTYEGTAKGYVGKRGSKGYKASFAYVHAQREALGCIFDKGTVNIDSHIDNLLELVKMRIGSPKVREIVIRGDAAFGNSSIVDKCIDSGYPFFFRGMHINSARKYAKRIKEWVRINKPNHEKLYAGKFRGRIFGSDHRIRVIAFKHVKKTMERSNTGIS